jgi:hypothetical protein
MLPPDGLSDAALVSPPVLVASAKTRTAGTSSLLFPLTVPPGVDRFLIVSAGIGSERMDPNVAMVTGVTYAGVPLKRIDAATGTTCGANVTRSEQWQLVAPAMGTNDVVITLSEPGLTLHGGALAFTGSNQTIPVRASMTGRGANTAASVVVPSAIGDLVVSSGCCRRWLCPLRCRCCHYWCCRSRCAWWCPRGGSVSSNRPW